MLYLTRKLGQSIIINDKIEVKIVEIKGANVKIGIEYPKGTNVLRKEIYENIVAENLEALKPQSSEQLGFFESIVKQVEADRLNQEKTDKND